MRYLTAVLLLMPFLCACGVMQEISTQSFRNATATGAKVELHRLGESLHGGLRCTLPAGNTMSVVRVHCTGRTVRGEQVTVTGIARNATTAHPTQDFVITVGSRKVLHKPCLGTGCKAMAN